MLSKYDGEPFNIGIEFPEISIGELAEKIISISGKNLNVKYKKNDDIAYLTDNPHRRCPSIKKAKELLKYNPKVEIEEGLRRTYQYYLDHPSDDEL